jgi:trans-aconitate methyltransferase
MNIEQLRLHWDSLGKDDPLWAILTHPDKKRGRWALDKFFQSGADEIRGVMESLRRLGHTERLGRAMDFGCGVGRLTQALAVYCDEVVGVDIAASMIEHANGFNRHGQRCRYVLNTGADLAALDPLRFDFIYSNIVLQHMAPQHSAGYIREFIRLLAPNGVLVFQLPEKPAKTSVGLLLNVLPVGLVRTFRKMDMYGTPRDRVVRLVEEAGARIIDVQADSQAGPHWIGHRYYIRKHGAAATPANAL